MPKVIKVTATITTSLSASYLVDDHVNEDDLMDHLKNVGASGEFEEDGDGEWTWGDTDICSFDTLTEYIKSAEDAEDWLGEIPNPETETEEEDA